MNIGLTTLGSRRTLAVSRPPDMRRRCRNPVSLCEEREFTSSQILRSWRPMLRCIVDLQEAMGQKQVIVSSGNLLMK